MPTIAELQIKVDSRPIDEGTKSLNDFSVAAERASKATKQKQQIDEQASSSAAKVSSSSESATTAISKQARELQVLIGKIDPVTKKLNDLAKQEATLFANKGNIPTAAFEQYNRVLEESFNKLLNAGSAQKQLSNATDGVPERLLRVGKAAVDAANSQQTLTTALRGASEAEQGLVSSGAVEASRRRAEAALEEFNARRQATQATRDSIAGNKSEAASLVELSGKIDPTLRKLDELRALREQLNKANANGAFAGNPEEFTRLTQVLDRNTEAYRRQNAQLANTGKTAKELAFAMRGLPAQFTDIVVSLQGGQAPLTVLLQQGGQIKDMFGGIAPAIRAVGTGLIALINPATVAAAVLATIAIAAYSGSEEITAFNRALILTNNAAGVSASGFAAYRDTLDSTVTTSGKAAEALTLLARGGQVLNDQFLNVAEAAILFQKATGQALSETINDFNALGKDPVDAAVRLDEKYRFLTASILEQADSLVRSGNETEASALLQDKLADATTQAATKVIEQAGYMERAWSSLKGVITETWDALKQIGRDPTSTDRLNILKDQLEALENRQKNNNSIFGGLGGSGIQKEIDAQKNLIKQVEQRIQYEDLLAKNSSEDEQRRADAVTAQASALRRRESALKGVEQAENNLRKVRLENEKIAAGGNLTSAQTALITENEERAVKALTAAKEAEARKNKPKGTPVDNREVQSVKNNLNQLNAEYDGYYKRVTAIGAAGIVSAEATFQAQKAILTAQKDAVNQSYDEQINSIKNLLDNKKNSASQNISLENQLSKAESDRIVALEKIDSKQDTLAAKEQGRIEKRTASISAYKAALDAQLESLQNEGARNADGVGRGSRQANVARQLGENDRSFNRQQRQLANSQAQGMDPEEYAAKLKDLQDAHTAMTNQILQNDRDIDRANMDWTNGFTAAVENARDAGMDFAGSVEQALTGAFNNAGNALATFVTTGKINFKSFTLSILADMAQIAARQAASGILSSLLSFGAAAAGSYFGGGAGANGFAAGSAGATSSSLGASQAGYSSQYFQAKGGAWSGGTQMFAQGGAFTNSIVSSPTSFGMANGSRGIMGEAGDEAIIPLARTRNGDLGVRLAGEMGGGGGAVTIVNVNVQVDGGGSQSQTDGGPAYDQFGNDLGNFVRQEVYTIINTETRPGGTLQPAR